VKQLRFVIVDMITPDGPLFWSNEDGWVAWGTESILEATATEAEAQKILPLGAYGSKDVQWVTRMTAERLVKHLQEKA
jgi:hypothetical protein